MRDMGRLELAFIRLREDGILALPNFGDCISCVNTEI